MKKLNKIMMILALVGCVGTAFNVANAEEVMGPAIGQIECIFDKEVYYEGETINTTWQLAEDYVVDNIKMTDFEMGLRGYLDEEELVLELTPVLSGAKYSYRQEKLHYIQTAALSDKVGLNAGEALATNQYKNIGDGNIFSEDDTEYSKEIKFNLDGTSYWTNDSMHVVVERYSTNVVAFEVGDLNRDHEVDFFDITELISVVYDGDESMLDWRQKYSVTTNTKAWFDQKGENPDYDYKTAYLGFADIIYLIKTVYD